MHLHPRACGSLLFFVCASWGYHGFARRATSVFRWTEAGAICTCTALAFGSLSFFVFWCMVFSPFRPAGDQRVPLDRSRCHSHLHLASLRLSLFFLFSGSWSFPDFARRATSVFRWTEAGAIRTCTSRAFGFFSFYKNRLIQ